MDTAVIKYYRSLLKTGFQNAGSLEAPSILLETFGDGRVCGSAGDYMRIFINISDDKIEGIKYLCTCDPAANVAVETICNLTKGKSLTDVQAITEDSVLQAVGTNGENFRDKARALLELLNKGLSQYKTSEL
ncbi:MAG TPA: iron-sulfur cluster assembly scaffold protein [Candidatus Acidoferrales bacterium]|nr:iron-sulfur cluster assembly scaffold protein [Candidatus Acidoferrales bacterium]